MVIKNLKKIKSIFDLDSILNNNEIFKDFIIEIFEVCQKITEETSEKFGIIFLRKGENEYLLLDYKILILALFEFLEKTNIETEDFNFIKKSFSIGDTMVLNDSMINLLFILAKKNLVYFSNLKKYYTKYQLCKHNNSYFYKTKFDGIAVKYPTIIKLFSDNEKILYEFEKLITRDFKTCENSSKIIESFCIEDFSQFNGYFHNNY